MEEEKEVVGYHVEVEPTRLGYFGGIYLSDSTIEPDEAKRLQLYKERCEDIAREIERHVDNVGSAVVVPDFA